jgi:hypothetical protein
LTPIPDSNNDRFQSESQVTREVNVKVFTSTKAKLLDSNNVQAPCQFPRSGAEHAKSTKSMSSAEAADKMH